MDALYSIVIGCDNAAITLKTVLKEMVASLGYDVEDVGCHSEGDDTYYPVIAEKVCSRIVGGDTRKLGVLVCGTGIGMAISANKCPGIRAAVCHDSYSAERAKLSNDCNVICFGERVVGAELAKKALKEWLSLEFADGGSTPKVEAIGRIEDRYFK